MKLNLFVSSASNDKLLGAIVRILNDIDARDHFAVRLLELFTWGTPVVSVDRAIACCKEGHAGLAESHRGEAELLTRFHGRHFCLSGLQPGCCPEIDVLKADRDKCIRLFGAPLDLENLFAVFFGIT